MFFRVPEKNEKNKKRGTLARRDKGGKKRLLNNSWSLKSTINKKLLYVSSLSEFFSLVRKMPQPARSQRTAQLGQHIKAGPARRFINWENGTSIHWGFPFQFIVLHSAAAPSCGASLAAVSRWCHLAGLQACAASPCAARCGAAGLQPAS